MPTQQLQVIPLATTELTFRSVVELLALEDEYLLLSAKSHIATEFVSALFPNALDTPSRVDAARAIALSGFLRERVERLAGKQLAILLRRSLTDGGRDDLCNWYCPLKSEIETKIRMIKQGLSALPVAAWIAENVGDIRERLQTELGEEFVEALDTIIEWLQTLSELVIDAADLAAPIRLPASIALFSLMYALDELCECDDRAFWT